MSCSTTTLWINVRLETGLWFFSSPLSGADCFFDIDVMMSYFADAGKLLSQRGMLTIAVMYCSNTNTSSDSFSRNVGIGSSVHDLVGDDMSGCRCPSTAAVHLATT